MKLQELLGPVTAATFLDLYYCKLPFASAGGCASLADLATWDVLGQLLEHREANLIATRGPERWTGDQPQTLEEGRELVRQGYTLGVRGAHLLHDGLTALAADFSREFAAPVDIHLYCTPAEQPGFSWHYDAEEVFVLQTAGSKEWSLRKNTVHPWPLIETLPSDMQYEREIMPLVCCTLEAGDWLYVPGGYWHATEGIEESISLSVGIAAPAAIQVFDWLRPQLLQSLLWRQRLPPLGAAGAIDRDELALRFRTLLDELAADLNRTLHRQDTVASLLSTLAQPQLARRDEIGQPGDSIAGAPRVGARAKPAADAPGQTSGLQPGSSPVRGGC